MPERETTWYGIETDRPTLEITDADGNEASFEPIGSGEFAVGASVNFVNRYGEESSTWGEAFLDPEQATEVYLLLGAWLEKVAQQALDTPVASQ